MVSFLLLASSQILCLLLLFQSKVSVHVCENNLRENNLNLNFYNLCCELFLSLVFFYNFFAFQPSQDRTDYIYMFFLFNQAKVGSIYIYICTRSKMGTRTILQYLTLTVDSLGPGQFYPQKWK
jgi:hypothetical protein